MPVNTLVAFCLCTLGFVAEACAPRVSLLQAYSTESARLRKWQALVGAKIPELRGEGFKISVTLKVTPEAPQPSAARQHNVPEAFLRMGKSKICWFRIYIFWRRGCACVVCVYLDFDDLLFAVPSIGFSIVDPRPLAPPESTRPWQGSLFPCSDSHDRPHRSHLASCGAGSGSCYKATCQTTTTS